MIMNVINTKSTRGRFSIVFAIALSLLANCTLADKNESEKNGSDLNRSVTSSVNKNIDGKWVSSAQSNDAGIFREKCGMCHLPGGMGTGLLSRRYQGDLALLENRKDLQAAFIETVVRNGFNTMFPISRAEVSDEQLQAIIRHLSQE